MAIDLDTAIVTNKTIPFPVDLIPHISLLIQECEAEMSDHYDFTKKQDSEAYIEMRKATEAIRNYLEGEGINLEAWLGFNIDQIPIIWNREEFLQNV